jgi:hypothetical protein
VVHPPPSEDAATLCERNAAIDLSDLTQNTVIDGELRMSFANVFPGVNLLISTDESVWPYSPANPARNNVNGQFIEINMMCGGATVFNVAFTDATTGEPVAIPEFTLTIYDVDQGGSDENAVGRESVTVCGARSFGADSHYLEITEEGDCTTAASTRFGNRGNNPTSTCGMDEEQLGSSIDFAFHATDSANINFALEACRRGRSIMFTLNNPTVCCD